MMEADLPLDPWRSVCCAEKLGGDAEPPDWMLGQPRAATVSCDDCDGVVILKTMLLFRAAMVVGKDDVGALWR